MKITHLFGIAAIASATLVNISEAASLAIDDEYIIAANGTVIPVGGDAATAFNSGNPDNAAAWDYAARHRQNAAQTDRMVATFLAFDTSTLTAADVNDPNFSAAFTIDHVGRLNGVNAGMDLGVGQVVSGNWVNSGAVNPDFIWAAASTNQATLLSNVQNFQNTEAGLTYDVTAIVADWVNGTAPNQGLALFGYLEDGTGILTNGSYLDNAALNWEVVPEPSTGLLGLLGASAFLFRRRRA